MREIKFRAWDELKKEWMYGLPSSDTDFIEYTKIPALMVNSTDENYGYLAEIMAGTLGQYTGLKDKNGVEIYEGDIVKTQEGDVQEVKWVNEELGFGVFVAFICYSKKPPHAMGLAKTDEVIGNIHENPELLKDAL